MHYLRYLTIVFPLVFSIAQARETGNDKVSPFGEVDKFEGLIHKIGVIDEPDRRTEDDFALENKEDPAVVKRRYAATGAINCKNGKSYGSAQLTIKGNIVTTSAHIFTIGDTCVVKFAPSDCLFVFESEGKQRQVKIEKKLASGLDGRSCSQEVADDWVILKLSENVTDVKPYAVDQGAVAEVNNKSKVIAVARSLDFRTVSDKGGIRNYAFPKHVGKCSVKQVNGIPSYEFVTNCDSAGFSSGGSLLTVGENPTLLGIHYGSTEAREAGEAAMKSGIPNRCAYDEFKCSSNYVPLNGRFYDALMNATK